MSAALNMASKELQMNQRRSTREKKLAKQCTVLADVIISIRPVYSRAAPIQKALIETMIGAAIWYIPRAPDAWTGYISLGALKVFHPDSGVERPKFSEEHVYPRKVAARLLLGDEALNGSGMAEIFLNKYGRLHYITPDENKSVQKHQRVAVFSTPDDAYNKAGITLIQVAKHDLRLIKKRDRDTIEHYVSNL